MSPCFNFILFNFTILYWFCHISKWICHRHTCVPHPEPSSLLPPHTIPLGRPSAPAPSIQNPASNLDWWLVSYMILYLFQCHSPKSSHPLPLPQSPKDCSMHQCLFCCLVYRVIVTIFLNSIYMCWYTVLMSPSVQFSRSVVSNSLRPHESQHSRPSCPSPTPGVHPNSCASSWWCHPAISSSVVPFSSCPQSLPASESFPMSQLFARGDQSTGVSALASFLPKNTQGWSPLEWTGCLLSFILFFSLSSAYQYFSLFKE